MKTELTSAVSTPLSLRWREFRIKYLPAAVFLGTVGGCVLLWQPAVLNRGITGVADGTRSTLVSAQPGTLLSLHVNAFDTILPGQPLGVIQPKDTRAELDLLGSDLQIARLQLEPSLEEETQFNVDRIQLELLRLRSDHSVARVSLQRAEIELQRSKVLHEEKLLSDMAFELVEKARDLLVAEINEKERSIQILEKRTADLHRSASSRFPSNPAFGTNATHAALAQLRSLRDAAATNFAPKTLTAPIAGMIGALYKQPGEALLEGDSILLINSLWSERVIGYLRHPFPPLPQLGREVMLTTQERNPRKVRGLISHIGAQVVPITNALATVVQGKLMDVGLPIVIDIPIEARIRPGEMMTIHLPEPSTTPISTARATFRTGAPSTSLPGL